MIVGCCQQTFEFSLKVKVMGLNPGYLLKFNDHPTRCKLNHICYATACAAGTIQAKKAWTPESVIWHLLEKF